MSKRRIHRSPNYPMIGLADALQRLSQLWSAEKQHPTTLDVVSGHWGYKSPSAGGYQVVAALKAYGLVGTEGSGDKRKVHVNEAGRRLILDSRPNTNPEKQKLLERAALSPKMHEELWAKWQGEPPSKASMRNYLVLERGFNENAVDGFIDNYLKTLAYAGLIGSGTVTEENDGADGADAENPPLPPGEGGTPPKDIIIKELPGMNQDTFTLDEGRVVLQWPAEISPTSFEDLSDWIDLMKRRIGRAVQEPKPESGNGE